MLVEQQCAFHGFGVHLNLSAASFIDAIEAMPDEFIGILNSPRITSTNHFVAAIVTVTGLR